MSVMGVGAWLGGLRRGSRPARWCWSSVGIGYLATSTGRVER